MSNIIITGGELFNKGAMALTLVTVSELRKRFPNHDIYLLSEMDLQRSPEELEQYAFKFTGWYPIKFARAQKSLLLKILCTLRNYKEYNECKDLYSNCDLMIDISGYALADKFSYATVNRYLEHLEFAKAFGIPVYLMPQSFGPFSFSYENKYLLLDRCKRDLGYAKKIYAREELGFAELEELGLINIELADDIVLCNKEVDFSLVYKTVPELQIPLIDSHSVAVIPNGMAVKVKTKEKVLDIYKEIIESLLTLGKKVYILSHSSQDMLLCNEITSCFEDTESVELLSRDFSCIEYNELAGRFDYIIASRYHSIIHAYKNLIPCIALGWADKYNNLLSVFNQDGYLFDFRKDIDMKSVHASILQIEQRFEEERGVIELHLKQVQKRNVFDEIEM